MSALSSYGKNSTQGEPIELPNWERTAGLSRFVAYTSRLERELILHASELAAPPTVALDIGCEAGRFSQILAERGWSMICADINSRALELCQQRIPGARCVLLTEDNRKVPCDDSSLGMLLCIDCPVMPEEWFAREATRALRTGGVLVGVFSNKLSWRGAFSHMLASLRGCQDWYSNSYPSWRRAMRARGFKMVRELGWRWPPFSITSNSPLLPLAFAAERAMGLRKLVAVSPLVGFVAIKKNVTAAQ
jgi:SAM-dependent methyltransferase